MLLVLKVLVDPGVFRFGRCGMTRYYEAVCEGLQERGVTLSLPLLTSNCDFHVPVSRCTQWMRRLPIAARVLDMLTRKLFYVWVRFGKYDVVLLTSPDFDSGFLKHRPDVPFAMVVHDLMTCVTAPEGVFDAAGPGLMRLLSTASRANRVICISNDTRDALLRQGVVDEARVETVPTGNLLAMREVPVSAPVLPEQFLLFVGERSGRKGFFALARALEPMLQEFPKLHLVCTGRLSAEEEDYLTRWGLQGRVMAIAADDSTLVNLYRRAFALVYPSLYEGFGLPVVEAMHFGCPVITTQNGALREIAGTAALFVDPFRPETMQEALRTLLRDPECRARLMAQGAAQAAQFSVAGMMDAFREVLGRAAAESPPRR